MQCKYFQEPKKLLNSICEVQIDGKMALVSLYDDLPHFEYDLTIDNLEDSNSKLQKCIQELKESKQKLEKELLHFRSVNKTLSKNITALYKTATSEIQRKDKIIEELRQSQISEQSKSKMFSSANNLFKEKYPKSSEKNKDTNQINHTADASKELIQNDNNISSIIVHPNRNIPKTVYYKRLCQKLVSQNETLKSNNMMPKQLENSNANTTNKITIDTNEVLQNDSDVSKEIETTLIHNDPKENVRSTLVVCKTDVIPNDCKFDNTPMVQCDKPENGKDNTLLSFFSKLNNPIKLKKKMVITPATIGIQNLPYKTLKNVEKLNTSKNVVCSTPCTNNNSSQNQMINTLIKDTHSTLINEHKDTMIDLKTDDKLLPTTYKVISQNLSTSVNNDQILPMEIETAPISFKNEAITVKTDNSLVVNKLKESSSITCKQLSIDNKYKNSHKCVELPTESKKKSIEKLSSPIICKQLSTDNEYGKSMKCEKLFMKNANKSLGKVSSPISSKQLSTNYDYDKSIKCVKSPTYKEKKSSSSFQQTNKKLDHKSIASKDVCNLTNNSTKSCTKNKSLETSLVDKTSINIEVEQVPFKTRTIKILKDNNTLALTKVKECPRVNYINPSVDNEFNMSNKHIKKLSMSDENELISLELKKNQPEHKSPALNHSNKLAEFTQLNSSLKNKSEENSLVNNTSINIEVEQGSIFRRSNSRKVITHSSIDHDKTETKKGRRVQLITIKDHYSQPLPSFNGAKKKEIDVSKNAIHIEKVVESSSLFYIPQVKRRRTINFSNAES